MTAELPDEATESVDKESEEEAGEEKVLMVESEEKGDLEDGKKDEMEVDANDVVEEEANEAAKTEDEAEEKAGIEEVVPPLPEEESLISTSLPTKEETPIEVAAKATPAHRPLPAIRSRIFELYLVGNKYNPTNFW